MNEDILARLDKILIGIDKHEIEDKSGWWETSIGADFGAKKKEEIKQFIVEILAAEREKRNKEIISLLEQYKSYYNPTGDERNTGKHELANDLIAALKSPTTIEVIRYEG